MKAVFAFFCSLFLFVFSSAAQTAAKLSRIKIYANLDGLAKIYQNVIDFDHGVYDNEAETYINSFPASIVQQIRDLGFRVDVLVDDVVAYTDSLNAVFNDSLKNAQSSGMFNNVPIKSKPTLQVLASTNFTAPCQSYDTYITAPTTFKYGSMGGFYNLAELNAEIDSMVKYYPSIVSKGTIGNTLLNVPIPYVKISDNVGTDENEPEVLYTGMNHSREGMSMMNLMFFMKYLLENYATNPKIKEIIDSRELFFIPVVNVDGFNWNTTASNWNAGLRFRRKNMRETNGTAGIQYNTSATSSYPGSGGDGVDINRNYGQYWGTSYELTTTSGQTGSSATTTADDYRGSAAFSEPETQHMRDFVDSRFFKMALNYHCFGNWWIRASGPDDVKYPAVALSAANVNIYNSIANLFTKQNCYVYGTPKQTVYPVNGYSDDYLFTGSSKGPIFAFSPEIGGSSDDFWAPQARIIPIAKELVFPNLQAAYTAGSYAELGDNSDIAIASTTGTFDFTVTRRGLTDSAITITLVPLKNIQSVGAPVTIAVNTLTAFGNSYSGSINYTLPSTLAAGSFVKYIWQLQTGGITIRDTITKLFKPTTVFSDNMDTTTTGNFTTKWTKAGTNSAWAYEAGTGTSGTASLTESPSGNYANSADQSVQMATAFSLASASDAYLSFMIKYQSENCQDRLQVEVSTSGGATNTYTPICTENTIVENRGTLGGKPALTGSTDGYVREIVSLKNYIGNTNLSLRFRFLSGASTRPAYNTNGFNIDNLKIVKSNATILPVRFEDLTAMRVNETVLLRWKAQPDAQFAYYEVERSQNGRVFKSLDHIAFKDADQYTDKAPLLGYNYYRIKSVDVDGTTRYSKTVLIIFAASTPITLYPNPATNFVMIGMTSDVSQDVQVELLSLEGSMAGRQSFHVKKGGNTLRLTLPYRSWSLYVVRIKDASGAVLKEQKLLKTE